MLENTLWHRASQLEIQTGPNIVGNFDIGFDAEIPENMRVELRAFVAWVEGHFRLPVTLWVDFEYKHYLVSRQKKRVGYLFYWADFSNYPVFEKEEDIPVIRLPVRTEKSTLEEVLQSFIEAISLYYVWLSNQMKDGDSWDSDEVEEILQTYLAYRNSQMS